MKITITNEKGFHEEIELSNIEAIALSIALTVEKSKLKNDPVTLAIFNGLDSNLVRATDLSSEQFVELIQHYIGVFTSK